MAPKKKFTKQQVIDSAFEIAQKEGIDGITIRKVADHLGSSIAPIYVNFNDVEELKSAVVKKVAEVSKQMLNELDTGNPFHDIGVASLRFAKKYSVIYKDFVLNHSHHLTDYDQEIGPELIGNMKKDPLLNGFTDEELLEILLKMRIFTVGLSILSASGGLPEHMDEAKTIELMDRMAADVIIGMRERKNKGLDH